MSSFTLQYQLNDTRDVQGYSTPGCCCRSPTRPDPCATIAKNRKTYLVLIFIPYLFLIVMFHTQLQVYDSGTKVIEEEGAFSGQKHNAENQDRSFVFRGLLKKRETVTKVHQGTKHNGEIFEPLSKNMRRNTNRVGYINSNLDEKEYLTESEKVIKSAINNVYNGNSSLLRTPNDEHSNGQDGKQNSKNLFAYLTVNKSNSSPWNSVYPISQECKDSLVSTKIPYIHFQPLLSHWVYTAYYDARGPGPPAVRVILLLQKEDEADFYCHFKSTSVSSSHNFITVIPSFYEMCENHAKDYGGWIMSCEVPSHFEKPPCEVTISNNRFYKVESSTNVFVPVFTLTAPKREQFGICIPPLFGYITSTTLIEFIEMTKLLGANHLIFYAHQISREVQKVLLYYHQQGSITVIKWDLPVADKHIWYLGQLLAINDCLYRNMHRFQFLSFNDLDEFIVPHATGALNWSDMMNVINKEASALESHNSTKHCGYSFLSAFFDPLSSGSRVLYDLESDLRTKALSSIRTKCMVIPERMFELGIHHMSRPISSEYKPFYVHPSVAFMHHYRKCVTDYDPKMNCQVFIRDEGLSPYIPSLRHNVHEKLWTLKEMEKKHQLGSNTAYVYGT